MNNKVNGNILFARFPAFKLVLSFALLLSVLCFFTQSSQASPIDFLQHDVDARFAYTSSAYAADLDGDEDLDIVGATPVVTDYAIAWWENEDGEGTSWVKHAILEIPGAGTAIPADLDGDGDMDLAASVSQNNDVMWIENVEGDGLHWEFYVLDYDPNFDSVSMYPFDIDGDGDVDILTGKTYDQLVSWWENIAGDGSVWEEHLINDAFDYPNAVHAADIDQDGDTDVLGAAPRDNEIVWWENVDGDGTVWAETIVAPYFNGAYSVHADDVDGDGDTDILGAARAGGDIVWWENVDGDGAVWTEHLVEGNFDGAHHVTTADLDYDGDVDILGASQYSMYLTWWENGNGFGTAWVRHDLSASFRNAAMSDPADIDGDGDLDVLGAAQDSSTPGINIAWWENTNLAPDCAVVAVTPTGPQLVDTEFSFSAIYADVDPGTGLTMHWDWGDEDTDSAALSEGSGTITAVHAYTDPGIYLASLTVTDGFGARCNISFEHVIVYDPDEGMTLGGGYFTSPAGSYSGDPTGDQRAFIGFLVWYKPHLTEPVGRFHFKLVPERWRVDGSGFDWLVINGKTATFQGHGQVNGMGDYGFLIMVTDNHKSPDLLRVRIWDNDTGDVIYDNQREDDLFVPATVPLARGNFRVVTFKQRN